MSLMKYITGMLPVFTRSRLQEDLKSATGVYTTMVVPSLAMLTKEFKGQPSSQEGKELIAEISSVAGLNKNAFFTDLAKAMAKAAPIHDGIEAAITKEFEDRIVPASMSLRGANLVRLVNVVDFLNNYTMALINAIVHYELSTKGAPMVYISDVTPGEYQRLRKGALDYAQLLRVITTIKDFEKGLESIPDITVDAKDIASAFGASADPFNLSNAGLGFVGYPVYYIAMMVPEYQHNKYKANENRKRALEKRLLALNRLNAGNPSAQLESDLEVITSQIANIAEAQRKYEESVK